ncbi:DUF3168 domain-containing protein [Bacillus paralicheniformis]|uniref:DUF3168 domain-containing protein n=1 Tax=Bacillus paralicheniformis TaxID=1648923 RepID=UPI00203CE9FB|nr:DUF3168 domain-containing protein [Bacillus paralicheniformis]MCM3425558.1 DUF3168 domain-containing protein [Bacillus paralicheniformis]
MTQEMKLAIWELQKALYDRLSTDAALNEKITGVYDNPNKDTPFPYVVIGEDTSTPFETKTSFGENITTVIHAWSRAPDGKREAKEILSLVLQALSKAPLEIEGFTFLDMRLQNAAVITDIDGITQHGILRLRLYINN